MGFVYGRSSKTLHPLGRCVARKMSASDPQRKKNFTETIHASYGHLDPPPIVVTVSLDVTSEQAADTAVKVVKRHVSSIDILISNAGHL